MLLFCSQQRVFAVHVFELHRLIKVPKLIAASLELLLQSELHLGIVVYNAHMNGLLKGTNSQKVVEIFERMKRDHCEPSTETYTMMINLYGKVWWNCLDDYTNPISIWHPRAPDGFVSPGCIAVPSFEEPDSDLVYCVAESIAEETVFEDQKIWSAPDSYPWACHIYQVKGYALHLVALRLPRADESS